MNPRLLNYKLSKSILPGLLILILVSCDTKEELDLKIIQDTDLDISGRIIEDTCGGTVIQVLSTDIGEEWVNIFGNSEKYKNAVLSNLEINGDFELNQLVSFNFREVEYFEGFYCDIGGLPDTKIEILDIKKKN